MLLDLAIELEWRIDGLSEHKPIEGVQNLTMILCYGMLVCGVWLSWSFLPNKTIHPWSDGYAVALACLLQWPDG